ncbi:site-specific integrase [Agromyces subbeticus]|uniref:site-specific integrase n=1 Tax=Agromyces subbeticus TaxID=293890 RepID=UPI0003B56464|nr:site-specific integrase [Agromyces subbeticus]
MTIPAATKSTERTQPALPQLASIATRPRQLTAPDLVANRYDSTVSAEVILAVERYKPKRPTPGWERVGPFAQELAARASDDSTGAARTMVILSPYLLWCITEQGLPMATEDLLTPRIIDAYIGSLGLADGTKATYRSKLIDTAERLNPDGFPQRMKRIGRRSIAAPYSPTEMTEFENWANGQASEIKTRKARLMLALCAGAGLRPGELELLCSDVTVDDQGILLAIRSGETPRDVPVLRRWESWITAELDKLPADGPLWMSDGQRKNKSLLNAFTEKTSGKAPNGSRLRATWIVAHLAAGTPIKELMRAAGMVQFNNLHHYLVYVDDVGPLAYRTAVRGSAER